MLHWVLLSVVVLFPVSEVVLALVKRSRSGSAQSADKGSILILWLSVVLGLLLAISARAVPSTRLPVSLPTLRLTSLALLLCGLTVRWVAILTLGRFFTVDVAIHSDHAVVQHGLYRFARHPSYTGLLIAMLGLGVFFGNGMSVVGLLVPVTLGVRNRVRKEERALLASLGPAYADYCARTKRFLPGLF